MFFFPDSTLNDAPVSSFRAEGPHHSDLFGAFSACSSLLRLGALHSNRGGGCWGGDTHKIALNILV